MNLINLSKKSRKVFKKYKNAQYNLFRRYYKFDDYWDFDLNIDEDGIVFNFQNDGIIKNLFLCVIHRSSKRNLEKEICSSIVYLSFEELFELSDFGIFDFYFKFNGKLFKVNERIKYNYNAQYSKSFKKDDTLFEFYSTIYCSLSLRISKDYYIYELNIVDDKLFAFGNFESGDKNNDKFLEIKHRATGLRLEQKIESSVAYFPLNHLLEMGVYGIFDLYIKINNNDEYTKKRIKYNFNNQSFKLVLKEKNLVLTAYSTLFNSLSFKLKNNDFDHNIDYLDTKRNKIFIKGNFELLNREINDIDKVLIFSKSFADSRIHYHNMDFKRIDDNHFNFEGLIDERNFFEGEVLNLRLDFYIRIYSDDIYYQSFVDLSNYKCFKNEEDRFLIKFVFDDNIYSYYATKNKNSLALWITTETSWNKSYTIAKGRTIYNNYLNEPLNENMVFFESFLGKSYSGNPKYIYECMLKMGLDKKYTFVWACSNKNKDIIPGNPIIVDRYEAGDYYRYLAQAKYWVNNIIFPIHNKRQGNVYLQTWHGTPLKKLGFDITIQGPEVEGRRNFYTESRNWDYLISSNKYSSKIFERAFKFEKEFLELGYPINDIFYEDNTDLINNLKFKFNISKNKKIILYAPTWKDDEQKESWEHYFNLELDLNRFFNEFKDEYILLLKMHHLVSERLIIDKELEDFVIDLSNYDDIQELYVLSDILITDYSSVFFDYAHSKKPILFFTPDLNHYIRNVRGVYLNMEKELPGPIIKNNEELINTIKNIDKVMNDYKEKYDEFYNRFCSLCDGNSAENIIKKVFKN